MNSKYWDIGICAGAMAIAFTVKTSDPWWAHGLAGAYFGLCAAFYLARWGMSKINAQ